MLGFMARDLEIVREGSWHCSRVDEGHRDCSRVVNLIPAV